jgi:hypothetical protein
MPLGARARCHGEPDFGPDRLGRAAMPIARPAITAGSSCLRQQSRLSLSEAERIRITLVIDAPEPLPRSNRSELKGHARERLGRAQPRHLS